MMFIRSLFIVVLFSVSSLAQIAPAPAASPSPMPTPTPTPKMVRKTSLGAGYIKDIVHDQKVIWTSPFRLDREDAKWAVPLFVGAGALIATERYTYGWVQQGGTLPVFSHDVSWFGKAYVTGGVAAG